MRRLAIFSFAFAAAALLYVLFLPRTVCTVLLCAAALTGLILLFIRKDATQRVRLAAFGLAFGMLWCAVYEQRELTPMQELEQTVAEIRVRLTDAPEQTEYGYRVLCEYEGARMLLYLDENCGIFQLGDCIVLEAEVVDVTQNENLYYVSRDIQLLGFQRDACTLLSSERRWTDYPILAYHSLQDKVTELFPSEAEPFARALLTGDTSGLSYEVRNEMSLVGISHIVAVSGMHVSLICALIMNLFLQRRRLAAGFCLAAMWFFAAMMGFTPSVTRAVVMNSLLLLAPLFKRENDGMTSLSFALLLLLLRNPWAIASVSLQLSFASVAGILIFAKPISKWFIKMLRIGKMRKEKKKSKRVLSGILYAACISISTTMGATLLTLPLVAHYFGTISLIAFLSNLILLPILSSVFTLGYVAVILGFFLTILAEPLAVLLSLGLRFALWLIDALAQFPYAALYTESIYAVVWLFVLYLLIALFCICRFRVYQLMLAMSASLAAVLLFQSMDLTQLRMTMLDVGQGQCILLESGDLTAVVDCGGSEGERAGEDAARNLLSRGVSQMDALILTHYDTDHVGGALQLISRMEIGRLFLPDITTDNEWRSAIEQTARSYDIPVYYVEEDVELLFSEGTLSIFAPQGTSSTNDGLSVLLSVEEYDILITGDMGFSAERELMRTHALPDVEVLVAGHHGSRTSTSPQLLQTVRPEALLISVGENSYGHPSEDVLKRAASVGASVYRTDEHGTIEITR